MKKLLFLLFISAVIFSLGACSAQQNSKNTSILELIDVRRGDRSSWYDDFEIYREEYRKYKLNSDLFLGIGEYKENPNEAFASAKSNGENNIKSSVAAAYSAIDNYGSIIDEVMETYQKEDKVYYRYILLMELNRVSISTTVKEEKELIEKAKFIREEKINEAKSIIEKADSLFIEKKYSEAIINYENAILKLREAEDYQQIEIINGKIQKVQEAEAEELYKINSEKAAKNKKIIELESKKNPSIFDLKELLNLYEEKENSTKISEVKVLIKSKEAEIRKQDKIKQMKDFIKKTVKEGYLDKNYKEIYENINDYFDGKKIKKEKVEDKILKDIKTKSIKILIPYSSYEKENVKLLEKIIQNKNPKYYINSEAYKGVIDSNDFYKYKSFKIFYIKSFNLKSFYSTYGYFANFSLNGIFINYKKNEEKIIDYENKRSKYTDYSSKTGAKEGVLNENIKTFQ